MSAPYEDRGDADSIRAVPAAREHVHTLTKEKKGGTLIDDDNKSGEATLHPAAGDAYIDAEKAQDVYQPKIVVDGESES